MRMDVTDEELALAAGEGDAAAFAALLARVYDRVFRLSYRLTGSRQHAEDLTQDVCMALPTKLRSFRGQSRLTTWLYRVVYNAMLDRKRSDARYTSALKAWGDWEISRLHSIAEQDEQIKWLHDIMGNLPENLRDTLALILDGLTHAEVASILGISEGTISWRMSEIKKYLAAMHVEESI